MPELPEVETIRRDLLPEVRGRRITEAWVSENAPKLVQLMPREEFVRQIRGRRIEDLSRRGKYLQLHLDRGLTWVVHLRMTGRLMHSQSGCEGERFLRASFRLDDGTWLCYVDLRKLGMMWLVDEEALPTAKLGLEPLSDEFTAKRLRGLLARRSAPVKAVLMDQRAIAGIGNIYADEALFAARIDPRRPANSLSAREVNRVHRAVPAVLHVALGDRGSSFRDYVDGRGREGGHQLNVRVFRRTEQPCYVCGASIRRTRVGGRSTHFCPKCQK